MRIGTVISTPNGQRIEWLRVVARGRRLLVYTAGRIYYVRRGRMRLWKKR